MSGRKCKVDLGVIINALTYWHNNYAQFSHPPCSLLGRKVHEGKTYYYLESVLGPAGRKWIDEFYRESLGGNTLAWWHFLMSTTSYTPNAVCAMILEQLLETIKITVLRGKDTVTAVKLVEVQMKPEHYHPAVECYCDPSIPPSDVTEVGPDPLRVQTETERAHYIIGLHTNGGRVFALDVSSYQHKIPLILRPIQMTEYLLQYTSPGRILEEHPASEIVGDCKILYDNTRNDEEAAARTAELLANSTLMTPKMVSTITAVCAGVIVFDRMNWVLSRHGNEKDPVLAAFGDDFRARNDGWGADGGRAMPSGSLRTYFAPRAQERTPAGQPPAMPPGGTAS
jgi:hypothetical protein